MNSHSDDLVSMPFPAEILGVMARHADTLTRRVLASTCRDARDIILASRKKLCSLEDMSWKFLAYYDKPARHNKSFRAWFGLVFTPDVKVLAGFKRGVISPDILWGENALTESNKMHIAKIAARRGYMNVILWLLGQGCRPHYSILIARNHEPVAIELINSGVWPGDVKELCRRANTYQDYFPQEFWESPAVLDAKLSLAIEADDLEEFIRIRSEFSHGLLLEPELIAEIYLCASVNIYKYVSTQQQLPPWRDVLKKLADAQKSYLAFLAKNIEIVRFTYWFDHIPGRTQSVTQFLQTSWKLIVAAKLSIKYICGDYNLPAWTLDMADGKLVGQEIRIQDISKRFTCCDPRLVWLEKQQVVFSREELLAPDCWSPIESPDNILILLESAAVCSGCRARLTSKVSADPKKFWELRVSIIKLAYTSDDLELLKTMVDNRNRYPHTSVAKSLVLDGAISAWRVASGLTKTQPRSGSQATAHSVKK